MIETEEHNISIDSLESKILNRIDLFLDGDTLKNLNFTVTPGYLSAASGDQFSQTKDIRSGFYKLAEILSVKSDEELQLEERITTLSKAVRDVKPKETTKKIYKEPSMLFVDDTSKIEAELRSQFRQDDGKHLSDYQIDSLMTVLTCAALEKYKGLVSEDSRRALDGKICPIDEKEYKLLTGIAAKTALFKEAEDRNLIAPDDIDLGDYITFNGNSTTVTEIDRYNPHSAQLSTALIELQSLKDERTEFANENVNDLMDRFERYSKFIPKEQLEDIMLNQLDALTMFDCVPGTKDYVKKVNAIMNMQPKVLPPAEGWNVKGKNVSMEYFMADAKYCAEQVNEIIKEHDPNNETKQGMKASIMMNILQRDPTIDAYGAATNLFHGDGYSDDELKELSNLIKTAASYKKIPMLKSMERVRAEIHNQAVYGQLIGENTAYALGHGLDMDDAMEFGENTAKVQAAVMKKKRFNDANKEELMERYRDYMVCLTKEHMIDSEPKTELYTALERVINDELAEIMNAAVDKEIGRRVDGWVEATDLPEAEVRRKLKFEFSNPDGLSNVYIKSIKDGALKANIGNASMNVLRGLGAGLLTLGIDNDFKEDMFEHFVIQEIEEYEGELTVNGFDYEVMGNVGAHMQALVDAGSMNEIGLESYTELYSNAKEKGLSKDHRIAYGELALSYGCDDDVEGELATALLGFMEEAQKENLDSDTSMLYSIIKRRRKADVLAADHAKRLNKIFDKPKSYLDVRMAAGNMEDENQFAYWVDAAEKLSKKFELTESAEAATTMVMGCTKDNGVDSNVLEQRLDTTLDYSDKLSRSYGHVNFESVNRAVESVGQCDEKLSNSYFDALISLGTALPTNGEASQALMHIQSTLNLLVEGGSDSRDLELFVNDTDEILFREGESAVKEYVLKVKKIALEAYGAKMSSHSYVEVRKIIDTVSDTISPYLMRATAEKKSPQVIDALREQLYTNVLGNVYNHMIEGMKLRSLVDLTGK